MKYKLLPVLFFFTFWLLTVPVFAQETQPPDKAEQKQWNFRIGPYFWFLGIQGTIESPPTPTNFPEPEPSFDFDLSFREVSAALKFAFLIHTEYQGDRFFGIVHLTSFILQGDVITPLDLVLQDVEYRFGFVTGETLAGYKILRQDRFQVDGMLGLKFLYSSIGARGKALSTIEFDGERDFSWVNPVAATRFKYFLTPRLVLAGYADWAPFRPRKLTSYQVIGTVNAKVNKWLYISPGYRFWSLESEWEENIFQGNIKGFYLRLGAEF